MSAEKRWLTARDVCARLSVSRVTLWKLRRKGLLPGAVLPTGGLRFHLDAVTAFEKTLVAR